MTNEARKLETEANILLVRLVENASSGTPVKTVAEPKFEQATNKNFVQTRFARLKKSLRRRSVSIL